MHLNFLDFEQPIAELEAKIEELRFMTDSANLNVGEEIERLQHKISDLTKSIFSHLKPIQIVKLARHPQRPHALDYIERIFTDFEELYGDRHYNKGSAIVAGIAKLNNSSVAIIAQQKGRNTKDNLERNFGMPNPEEYRRALRVMKLAEKFSIPVITMIDTPGAYPGIAAEEHNQSEAIARNIFEMSKLGVPIISVVIGEGGSGGALAIGVADIVIMLQYSIYSVISPEGCASILWRSQEKIAEAADALSLTASKLLRLKLIDQVVREPLGGAHRDYDGIANSLKRYFVDNLKLLKSKSIEQLLKERQEKLFSYGR